MAAICGRRTLLSSSSNLKTLISRCYSLASATTETGRSASATRTFTRFSRNKLPFITRLPVELAGAQSLMPLHSVTASVLLNSMLSSKHGNWGWLSEGFATPL